MKWPKTLSAMWRRAATGAVLSTAIGLGVLWFGHEIFFLSYDLLFLFPTSATVKDTVIIYMDDRSFNELTQNSTQGWDRNLHARVLDHLSAAPARLVIFDIIFDLPGEPSANMNLVRAIRENGRVLLAAALDSYSRPQVQLKSMVGPSPEFLQAAAGWGITESMSPQAAVLRQYFVGSETQPSLPWQAARMIGATHNAAPPALQPETWLNYYGTALTLPHLSYADVLSQPSEFFRNKVVFIGARPKTLKAGDQADVFRTPHTFWNGQFMPGVEVTATAFLNLTRQEGLVLWEWNKQLLFVTLAGLILGGGLTWLRPLPALGLAIFGGFLLLVTALQAAQHHTWLGWSVVAFTQIPAALAWSWRCHYHRLRFEQEVLERTLAETSQRLPAPPKPQPSGWLIPDHTLVRMVGKGAYGEVWLARNAIGVFHAVKIVRRQEFPSDVPYEREFRGLQKFMPISRTHPGLVHILHVGRDDIAGFFFCIMEAADDETTGARIDPSTYTPKTLGRILASQGKLPPSECLEVGLMLSLALEHLHRQNLVHRDIKPGNIIYVNGQSKFADIGLVTDRGDAGAVDSLVGTVGYVPPEGPGTSGADIYALGKVLYECAMGRDRLVFPEVPTTLWEEPEESLLRCLNEVICRACETNIAERFVSAGDLHAALLKLRPRPPN
jgi:CHASE2 domain-containing sensor protein